MNKAEVTVFEEVSRLWPPTFSITIFSEPEINAASCEVPSNFYKYVWILCIKQMYEISQQK